MGKFGPESLRSFADALEDPRHMENVEACRRVPTLDQSLLLALNKWRGKEMELPDEGKVAGWLQDILVSVKTVDGQSTVLGLFCTNIDPFNRRGQRIVVCIFPLYGEIEHYLIRPYINSDSWESNGIARLTDGSSAGIDPFYVYNPKGYDLLFFKKSPFGSDEPYKPELPEESEYKLPELRLCDFALERNISERAYWYINKKKRPKLFMQNGFKNFIGKNRFNPSYAELNNALKFRLKRSDTAYNI